MEKIDKYSEVIFWDFTRKNNVNYNFEVVQLLLFASKSLKDKKLVNKLKKIINIYEKHDLLGTNSMIYLELHNLANVRNRVHVQNEYLQDPYDEKKLWSLSS